MPPPDQVGFSSRSLRLTHGEPPTRRSFWWSSSVRVMVTRRTFVDPSMARRPPFRCAGFLGAVTMHPPGLRG